MVVVATRRLKKLRRQQQYVLSELLGASCILKVQDEVLACCPDADADHVRNWLMFVYFHTVRYGIYPERKSLIDSMEWDGNRAWQFDCFNDFVTASNDEHAVEELLKEVQQG